MGMDIYGGLEVRHGEDRAWIFAHSISWMGRWPELQREVFYSGYIADRGIPEDTATKTFGELCQNPSHATWCKWPEFYPPYRYHSAQLDTKHTMEHWEMLVSVFETLANGFGYENVRLVVGFNH